jgi:hypothetical protein
VLSQLRCKRVSLRFDSESLPLRFSSQRLTKLRATQCKSPKSNCTPKCTLNTTSTDRLGAYTPLGNHPPAPSYLWVPYGLTLTVPPTGALTRPSRAPNHAEQF